MTPDAARSAALVKALLPESEMPTHWYNIQADLPEPMAPHLHPGTREPLGPEDLAPLFPMALIEQEVTAGRYVEIPEAVREIYRLWRPSPLIRARRLEKSLGTSARIYYKYEGTSPVGSHKPNTAVAQAYYNAAEGVTKLTTETGAGQWGASLAFAGQAFGIEVEVWQVKASFESKPYRRMLMETFGATVHPSPSDLTEAGRSFLAKAPGTPGSLGMAVAEAVERLGGSLDGPSMALLLARTKAESVAALDAADGAVVLGCDSVFELDGVSYGKPPTAEVALERWKAMRGKTGVLHTGHWLVDNRSTEEDDGGTGATLGTVASASVSFDEVTDEEIEAYVATGEPLPCAGAFTIDGRGAAFITGIDGDPHTVVGLSVNTLRHLLVSAELSITDLWG